MWVAKSMILWLILLTSRYDFFEINRSLSGDVILGEDIAKYCTNGGTDPCHCPEERPTFTGDLYSPTCADSQTIGCKLLGEIGDNQSTSLYVLSGESKYDINVTKATEGKLCFDEQSEVIITPIFIMDYQNKFMWNVVFGKHFESRIKATVLDGGNKLQLHIASHWTGLFLRLFVSCGMLEECVAIKFTGNRKYPLSEEIVKSVIGIPAPPKTTFYPTSTPIIPSSWPIVSSTSILPLSYSTTVKAFLSTIEIGKISPSEIIPQQVESKTPFVSALPLSSSLSNPSPINLKRSTLKASTTQLSAIPSTSIRPTPSSQVSLYLSSSSIALPVLPPPSNDALSVADDGHDHIIVGVVVAVLVIMLIIIVVVYMKRKRDRNKDLRVEEKQSRSFQSNSRVAQASIRSLSSDHATNHRISSTPSILNSIHFQPTRNQNPLFDTDMDYVSSITDDSVTAVTPRSEFTMSPLSSVHGTGNSNLGYDLDEDYYRSTDDEDLNIYDDNEGEIEDTPFERHKYPPIHNREK